MEWLALVSTGILAAEDFLEDRWTVVLQVVGVVSAVAAMLLLSYGSYRKKVPNLPPGPRNLPVIGALLEMESLLYKSVDKFATRYGPIVFFRLGVQNMVVLTSPEAVEELLRHKDEEFCNRQTAMNTSSAKYVGLDGISFPFANYDADYKLQRKIAITEFFTTASINSYEELRTQEVAVMVEKVFALIENANQNEDSRNSSPTPMDIRLIIVAAMQNLIFSLCIGKRFDSLPTTDKLREFPEILQNGVELVMSFNLADFFPWLRWLDPQGLLKRMKIFDQRQRAFYKTVIARSRQEQRSKRDSVVSTDTKVGNSKNFVEVLLKAQETGTKITDNGVMVTIREMLAGGIETTGTQTSWVLIELVRHPKVLQRLQHELDDVVGKDRPLEEADLQTMPFLNAVILETLRLHAIAAHLFPHVNKRPSTLCGYNIPANTAVIVSVWSMARDPQMWKDPLQFNPDRFMTSASSLPSFARVIIGLTTLSTGAFTEKADMNTICCDDSMSENYMSEKQLLKSLQGYCHRVSVLNDQWQDVDASQAIKRTSVQTFQKDFESTIFAGAIFLVLRHFQG